MYSLVESNNKIIELIQSNKPFYITRLEIMNLLFQYNI